MAFLYIEILLTFLVSFLSAWLMFPIVFKLASNKNLYDIQDARKSHKGKVPRLGGMCFLPSMLFGLMTLLGYNFLVDDVSMLSLFSSEARCLLFYGLAMSVIYATGVADDINGIRYRTKFAAQTLASILLICSGTWIHSFYGVLGIYEIPAWIGYPFTVLMTIFVINAFNLIDGIDGLSSSFFILSMVAYGVFFVLVGDVMGTILTALSIGAIISFLRYNLFGNATRGNKLFMGDTGSMTLGLTCLAMGMRLLGESDGVTIFNQQANGVILALAPILIPCFDVVRVYFYRMRRGRSPFLPDRNHIHHRLLDCGLSNLQTLNVLIFVGAVGCVFNVLFSGILNVNVLLLIDVILWILSTMYLRRRGERSRK